MLNKRWAKTVFVLEATLLVRGIAEGKCRFDEVLTGILLECESIDDYQLITHT